MNTVVKPMYIPTVMYLVKDFLLIIPSSVSLGSLSITSGSAGLNDKAVAGKPSVTKLTQRS